ncbi:MAG: PHP domain-containing protein [Advenella sp.]|jgi:predicted metal-dependent phosphoesterase TrpH|uniref:3',5'-nucleoside bisphosphate phosphatase n=1 Tax=unclassified Advenella TaxID=2685285 RepID=UPI00145DDF60|nr:MULTISPECIES: 3',5'-nucleoside bisphosphate phosphatase [unclassified Advenella]MDD3758901.1 PHP domain-containing protein [Advenella sp.]NLN67127.1 PHP domain-containing protein [Alcaligenaceae bacterium]
MDSLVRLNVDLHCHSTVSDGVLSPTEVATRAAGNGVQVWSLTDHDEVGGQQEAARVARELGMTYIPGIEISVTWAEHTLHIVGLGIDPENAAMNAGLERIRNDREQRARVMSDKLAEFGIMNAYEGALKYADNPNLLSRTHFARYIVETGHCKHMQEVFDKYLADGKPAYIAGDWASLEEAINWITQAGGIAVIAHPGRYKYSRSEFVTLYKTFKLMGGRGIEVVTGSHTVDQYHQYAHIARQYGFLASCGSDFHSPSESSMDLGKLPPLPSGLTPVWEELI